MGFVLSAVIFLTSTGFLVDAALALARPAVIAPASAPGASEGGTTVPQLSPDITETLQWRSSMERWNFLALQQVFDTAMDISSARATRRGCDMAAPHIVSTSADVRSAD